MTNMLENNMRPLESVISYVCGAMDGRLDKGDQPMIFHSLRVMMDPALTTLLEREVAVCHDLLEDTPLNFEDLKRFAGKEVAEAVQILTKQKDETGIEGGYLDFINRILDSGNKVAIAVKKADIRDNSNPARLIQLSTKEEMVYLTRKYSLAKSLIGM